MEREREREVVCSGWSSVVPYPGGDVSGVSDGDLKWRLNWRLSRFFAFSGRKSSRKSLPLTTTQWIQLIF